MGTVVLASLAVALVAYLLGSINWAVIISTVFFKKDVREFGSGNAGMTNMLRTFGKGAAAATLVGDFMKGVLAVLFARWLFGYLGITLFDGGYVAGAAALLGHIFPAYFGFRGGKGVLPSLGIMMILDPMVFAVVLLPSLVVLIVVKIVSVASLFGAVLFPFATALVRYLSHRPVLADTIFAAVVSAVVIYMHRSNIRRLLDGTENSFRRPKQP